MLMKPVIDMHRPDSVFELALPEAASNLKRGLELSLRADAYPAGDVY